jgi:hypothetical protein
MSGFPNQAGESPAPDPLVSGNLTVPPLVENGCNAQEINMVCQLLTLGSDAGGMWCKDFLQI